MLVRSISPCIHTPITNQSIPAPANTISRISHDIKGEKKDLENKMKIKYDLKSNFLSFQRCRDNLS